MVDCILLRSSYQGRRRWQNVFTFNVIRKRSISTVCLFFRQHFSRKKTRMYQGQKSLAGINTLPFFKYRLSVGSSACLWLLNVAYYWGELKHIIFIPSITSEPYESSYDWNRAQHERHYALTQQVVSTLPLLQKWRKQRFLKLKKHLRKSYFNSHFNINPFVVVAAQV